MYKEISFACGWPDGRMGGRADGRTHGRVGGRNGRAGLENLIILPHRNKSTILSDDVKIKAEYKELRQKHERKKSRYWEQKNTKNATKQHASEMQAA